MKHIATITLLLNLGVAGVYAHEKPVKMTFSGTLRRRPRIGPLLKARDAIYPANTSLAARLLMRSRYAPE
jgi:hypothetical protein